MCRCAGTVLTDSQLDTIKLAQLSDAVEWQKLRGQIRHVTRFLKIFSPERIRAQSCNGVQNSVLSCNINTLESVFASSVLAFLQSSSRIVCFFSEKFRSIM